MINQLSFNIPLQFGQAPKAKPKNWQADSFEYCGPARIYRNQHRAQTQLTATDMPPTYPKLNLSLFQTRKGRFKLVLEPDANAIRKMIGIGEITGLKKTKACWPFTKIVKNTSLLHHNDATSAEVVANEMMTAFQDVVTPPLPTTVDGKTIRQALKQANSLTIPVKLNAHKRLVLGRQLIILKPLVASAAYDPTVSDGFGNKENAILKPESPSSPGLLETFIPTSFRRIVHETALQGMRFLSGKREEFKTLQSALPPIVKVDTSAELQGLKGARILAQGGSIEDAAKAANMTTDEFLALIEKYSF